MIRNKISLCIVDYYSKFHIVMKVASLAVDNLVYMAKMILADFCLPKKIVSDVLYELHYQQMFQQYHRDIITQLSKIVSPTTGQTNGTGGQACINFAEYGTIPEMVIDTNWDVSLSSTADRINTHRCRAT